MREAELKLRDLHKVLGDIEELKSFVSIVGCLLLLICGSVIVNVGDAKKLYFVQKSDVLTETLLEEGSQGSEVVKEESFAKIEVVGRR